MDTITIHAPLIIIVLGVICLRAKLGDFEGFSRGQDFFDSQIVLSTVKGYFGVKKNAVQYLNYSTAY
jgi:hypothetical protein